MRKLAWTFLAVLALVALAVAHAWYWYLPRPREGRPGEATAAARLLASDAWPSAAWVPYPHQNLGALRRTTAADVGLVEAVARLAGLPEPSWPAFGNAPVPPAREIAFAAKDDDFALAAEVYPLAALFAKLAGRLARNPWLTGGELSIDGRPVEVAWRGNTWLVGSPRLPVLADVPAADGPPAFLVLEVRRDLDPLPSGRFHLVRDGADLVLRSTVGRGVVLGGEGFTDLEVFLLLIAGRRATAAGEPPQAMAFFAEDAPVALDGEGAVYELPGMAVIHETGSERWSLPGEGLLKLTGRDPKVAELGPWSVAALEEKSFARAQDLLPRLAPLVGPRPEGRLAWGLWLDLGRGRVEVARIAQALEALPFVSERRRARWHDAETTLAALARRYTELVVVVTEEPRGFELRLVGHVTGGDNRG